MNIKEYNLLKKRRYRVEYEMRNAQNQTLVLELQKQLKEIGEKIHQAEQEDPYILRYAELIEQIANTKRTIGSWKYYGKNTTALEQTLATLQDQLRKHESDTLPNDSQPSRSINPSPPHSETVLNTSVEPTYYIINLAWSKADDLIINATRDFLNMSNHIQFYQVHESSRNETIMTWKYTYDSIEEQSTVKSLRMAASHLLDVLKQYYPGKTDAEVFGKIQKY